MLIIHGPKCIEATQEELEERRGRSGVARMRRFREEISGSAVERIAQSVNTGPLLLLRQCQFAGGRIKLVTRHSRGVRGTCSGGICCLLYSLVHRCMTLQVR